MTAQADPSGLLDYLGITMDAGLLARALTHRSYAYEHGGLPHNERLEFLGDAVLGIVITDTLFRSHPDLSEGRLAKLRASVVNMRALASIARSIGPKDGGLGAYLLLGRGEEGTGGREKPSILADALEALFGAIYLEHGLERAARVIHDLFDDMLDDVVSGGAGLDWKTSLQELTAEYGLGVPEYQMTSTGPDHEKTFTARAQVAGELFAASAGRSKKEAEQLAAETAWRTITARQQGTNRGTGNGASASTAVAAGGDPANTGVTRDEGGNTVAVHDDGNTVAVRDDGNTVAVRDDDRA